MIPCPHTVQIDGVHYACLLEKGHAGSHTIVEPPQNVVATVAMPASMGGHTLYLWRDGVVTWKGSRS